MNLYIDVGDQQENKDIFDRLLAQKDEIETRFGEPLIWERLVNKRACRIKHVVALGGISSPEEEWPTIQNTMIEAMRRLEKAVGPALEGLKI